MKVGFKTGPKNWESEGRALAASGARACEVWFDIRREAEYEDMLAELGHQGVEIGLHHWGLVEGKYKTNLATNFEPVRAETMAQIRRTIDIGAEIGCGYLNAHPGARFLEELAFDPWQQRLVSGSETEPAQARELFLTAVDELQGYAREREVLLTIETLPALEVREGHGQRENAYNPENVPLALLEEMADAGGWLANDITHTAAQYMLGQDDLAQVWADLLAFTKRVAPATRLLHINTVLPPFNGTDSHDGVTDEDFGRGVWPNKDQVVALLRLFVNRDEVFVIPEPKDGAAVDNFTALKTLAEQAGA